jgi:hypothetical protein
MARIPPHKEVRRTEVNSLQDNYSELLMNVIGRRNLRQVRKDLPVWKIKASFFPRRGYEERKQRLLAKVIVDFVDFPGIFLQYSEDPKKDNLKGNWLHITQNTWTVPSDVDAKQFYDWLYLGNWMLYVSNQNLSKKSASEFNIWNPNSLILMMKHNSIRLVLSSFFDNDPWYLAVNPDL